MASTGAAVSTAIVQAAAQGMLQVYSMTDTQGKLHVAAPAAVAAWATAALLANRVSESSSCSTLKVVRVHCRAAGFLILASARAQQARCFAPCAGQLRPHLPFCQLLHVDQQPATPCVCCRLWVGRTHTQGRRASTANVCLPPLQYEASAELQKQLDAAAPHEFMCPIGR